MSLDRLRRAALRRAGASTLTTSSTIQNRPYKFNGLNVDTSVYTTSTYNHWLRRKQLQIAAPHSEPEKCRRYVDGGVYTEVVENKSQFAIVDNVANVDGSVRCDFETLSRCDIKTAGTHLYAADPTTEVIVFTYFVAGEFHEW